jgi:hypothetical protein
MLRSMLALLGLMLVVGSASAQAEAVYWPADSGYANVRDFGAKGDGVTDDTEALRKAFKQSAVYLPPGIYLVRETLRHLDPLILIQGAGSTRTTIRLADKTFTDAEKPQGVVRASASIQDLTVDVGAGNPGSVGLIGTNSVLRNVNIRSSDKEKLGRAGVVVYGDCLLQNVDIDGLAVGIQSGNGHLTLEDIAVHHQRNAGLYLQRSSAAIRQLTSQQDEARAIVGDGDLCISNAYLGGRAEAAIEWRGGVFARRVETEAYRNALKQDGELVAGPALEEYLPKVTTLFDTPKKPLDLPFEKMPAFESSDPVDWVSVKSFGAKGDGVQEDDVAIQKAIDSGKPIVYLPHGVYRIKKSIELRGSLRRLVGLGSKIEGTDFAVPRFRLADGKTPAVLVEQVSVVGPRGVAFEFGSERTLSLRSIRCACWICNGSKGHAPNIFLDDVETHSFKFENASVCARRLIVSGTRAEPVGDCLRLDLSGIDASAEVDGGTFASIGLSAGRLTVANGARVELLGGKPNISLTNSSLAVLGSGRSHVFEMQKGIQREGEIDGPFVGHRPD